MNDLLRSLIRETIDEANPAYAKHQQGKAQWDQLYQQKYGRGRPQHQQQQQFDPEKARIFHQVVDLLGNYVNLNDERKRTIWSKISQMNDQSTYWLVSYLKRGEKGWQDVKEFVLPGFQ